MSSTFTYTYHTLHNSMLLYDPNPVSIYMYLGYEMHDINFFVHFVQNRHISHFVLEVETL